MFKEKKAFVMFRPTHDILENPYIGFTSFNHIDEKKLFSDSYGNDGWMKEVYPLKGLLPENGWDDGWHPKTTVAYYRILWKDFEPEEGVYNYDLVGGILKQARKAHKHVMLRMMPHTTRASEDIPDWLKKKLSSYPSRPDDQRVKESPLDPLFLIAFANAVRKLGERFDSDPCLYAVDISLFGAWGEGSGYRDANPNAIDHLMLTYTDSFKKTFLLGQIIAPELVTAWNNEGRIGWRGDGTGHGTHMDSYFPRKAYQMKDVWKTAPVSLEAWAYMNAWERSGWDIDFIVEQILKWHVSMFNNKSSAVPHKWKENIRPLLERMGYRFAIRGLNYSDTVCVGGDLDLSFYIENRGNAPIYINLPFTVRLKSDKYECVLDTGVDIRKWMPGDTIEDIVVKLPKDIPVGTYTLEAGIVGNTPESPTVKFAQNSEKDGDYYVMTTVEVTNVK